MTEPSACQQDRRWEAGRRSRQQLEPNAELTYLPPARCARRSHRRRAQVTLDNLLRSDTPKYRSHLANSVDGTITVTGFDLEFLNGFIWFDDIQVNLAPVPAELQPPLVRLRWMISTARPRIRSGEGIIRR
jgi:hypothetical protein